jgi:hypothetical protein
MADEDVQEFTKDNPPGPGQGAWYRSKEMVYAHGPLTNVKVGGKHHKDTAVFVVIEDAVDNKQGKIKAVPATEFHEQFIAANATDPIPDPPGPSTPDAHEASKDQATGYQFEDGIQGDDEARQVLEKGQ